MKYYVGRINAFPKELIAEKSQEQKDQDEKSVSKWNQRNRKNKGPSSKLHSFSTKIVGKLLSTLRLGTLS